MSGKVKFGDGSCINIEGKGSIVLEGKSGEQRLLTKVYYLPELNSNIFSLGQATESGCDVRMKNDLLTMHDEDGKLLMKVTRSRNRLYKIKIKAGTPTCLLTNMHDESWKWHARLGHVNFATMSLMSKKGIVRGLPLMNQENRVCESCLIGKQARFPYPAESKFRAEQVLELISMVTYVVP